jgi:hypothetical protein
VRKLPGRQQAYYLQLAFHAYNNFPVLYLLVLRLVISGMVGRVFLAQLFTVARTTAAGGAEGGCRLCL